MIHPLGSRGSARVNTFHRNVNTGVKVTERVPNLRTLCKTIIGFRSELSHEYLTWQRRMKLEACLVLLSNQEGTSQDRSVDFSNPTEIGFVKNHSRSYRALVVGLYTPNPADGGSDTSRLFDHEWLNLLGGEYDSTGRSNERHSLWS
ncbi:hypothetical protein [Allocoleopsis sp.]|uniref:hypothetical protein n=1 Tax=Allocoleopsis sp. TaxID=3088169 RepID=UPI002FD390F9